MLKPFATFDRPTLGSGSICFGYPLWGGVLCRFGYVCRKFTIGVIALNLGILCLGLIVVETTASTTLVFMLMARITCDRGWNTDWWQTKPTVLNSRHLFRDRVFGEGQEKSELRSTVGHQLSKARIISAIRSHTRCPLI